MEKVRLSIGTAVVLGLEIALMDTSCAPTTAYLQTYYPNRCSANCRFCAQARGSHAKLDKIARGLYLPYDAKTVINRLKVAAKRGLTRRICIQTMNYPNMLDDLLWLVWKLNKAKSAPISVSVHPLSSSEQKKLRDAGAERIIIPLDAVNEEIFNEIKGTKVAGPYRWTNHLMALENAVRIMGKGNVGTHIMVGLGETEKELIFFVEELKNRGIYCGLFAFTPIPGTPMSKRAPPRPESYRRVKLASYLISKSLTRADQMGFSETGEIVNYGIEKDDLERLIESGLPFLTSGCPNCNRPFANEIPEKTVYNFSQNPSNSEIQTIKRQFTSEGQLSDDV